MSQDSAFLNLPLEIRHQIYNYFIRVGLKKGVTPYALIPLTNLTGVSQQIRCEVYNMIAAVKKFHISAGIFSDLTLKPLSIATEIRLMNTRTRSCFESLSPEDKCAFGTYVGRDIQNSKDEIKSKEPPAQFNFWRVHVSVFNTHGERRLTADINFQEKEVCVCRPGTLDDDVHDFEKAFINAMLEFTKEEGFNGVTIQDVSRYLEQVTLPNPNGFWTAEEMFEELKEAENYEQDEDSAVS